MSHGMRRRLLTMDGIYIPTAAVPLIDGGGTVIDQPTGGAQAMFKGGPWYTQIDWSQAIIGGAGRTTTQWFGSLGHAYVNSDHTSDAPTNNWHARNTDPIWTITGMFNGNVNVGGTAQIHIPDGFYVPFASGDQNGNVWNHDTGYHYDFNGARNINPSTHTMTADAIWQLHESEDGWGTGVYPNGRHRGSRACGAQFGGGDITAADWRAGFINHALGFAASQSNWKTNAAALPAVTLDKGTGPGYTGNVPLGTMFAIPPVSKGGPSKPAGLSTIGSMVWDCVSKYGMYGVDSTGSLAWYADDGNDPISSSWVSALAGNDGTAIVGATRMITRGKPSLPNHA